MKLKLIKIAKILFAESIKDIFVKYLKQKNISEQLIENASNKLKQINQNIQRWFVKNFIKANKNIEDLDVLINALNKYKSLSQKYHKNIQFSQLTNFETLYGFINNFQKKNNLHFEAPRYCQLILQSPNYKFYYADASDLKCFEQLNNINNTVEDGYANWCVVKGTVSWGSYTNSAFNFYIYGTKKDNTPFIFFNFGDDDDAQIKDIYDNTFTKYDKQLIEDINKIKDMYLYQFDIRNDVPQDYELFYNIDNIINKENQWKKTNISSPHFQIYKYNSPDTYFIVTDKNKKIQFLFKQDLNNYFSDGVIKYGKEKYSNNQFIDMLIKGKFNNALFCLIFSKCLNDNTNKDIVYKIVQYQLLNDYKHLYIQLTNKLITNKETLDVIRDALKSIVNNETNTKLNLNPFEAKQQLIKFNLIDQHETNKYLEDLLKEQNGKDKLIQLAQDESQKQKFEQSKQLLDKIIDIAINQFGSNNSYILYNIIQTHGKTISQNSWKKILDFYIRTNQSRFLAKIIYIQFNRGNYDNETKKIILDNSIKQMFNTHNCLELEQNFMLLDNFTIDYLLSNKEIKNKLDYDSITFFRLTPDLIDKSINLIVKYDMPQFADGLFYKKTLTKQQQKKLVQYLIDTDRELQLDYLMQEKRIKNIDNKNIVFEYFESKMNNKK